MGASAKSAPTVTLVTMMWVNFIAAIRQCGERSAPAINKFPSGSGSGEKVSLLAVERQRYLRIMARFSSRSQWPVEHARTKLGDGHGIEQKDEAADRDGVSTRPCNSLFAFLTSPWRVQS